MVEQLGTHQFQPSLNDAQRSEPFNRPAFGRWVSSDVSQSKYKRALNQTYPMRDGRSRGVKELKCGYEGRCFTQPVTNGGALSLLYTRQRDAFNLRPGFPRFQDPFRPLGAPPAMPLLIRSSSHHASPDKSSNGKSAASGLQVVIDVNKRCIRISTGFLPGTSHISIDIYIYIHTYIYICIHLL